MAVVTLPGAHRLADPNLTRGAGETSVRNPLRSTLDWQSAIGDTAEQAGGMIGGIFDGIDLLGDDGKLLDQPLLSWGLGLLTAPFNVGLSWLLDLLGIDPGETDGASRALVEGWFSNLRSFLPLPFTDPLFDVGEAAVDFIFDILEPTGLLALLDPVSALLSVFNIPGLDASKIISGQFALDMITGLIGVGGAILGNLIPGLDASKITSGLFGLPLLGNLFGGGGTFLGGLIPGLDASKITSGQFGLPLLGNLFDFGGGTFLGGLIPGLDASKIISGTFGLPLLGNLFGGGGTLLSGLIPGLDASKITGGMFGLPLLGNLFDTGGSLLSTLVPGIDASKITSGFFPMDMVLGLPSLLGSFLTSTSPLSALNLSGSLPASLFAAVPIGSLINTPTNLMPMGNFPADSIAANSKWQLDLATTFDADSTGSARVIADGTEQGLRGVAIPVQAGQKYRFSIRTKWSALAASGGSPIQMGVVEYRGTNNLMLGYTMISSVASAGASSGWVELQGDYEVPVGVDVVRMRLMVGSNAQAGNVWFDHAVGYPAGVIATDWVDGLAGQLGGIADMFGLGFIGDFIGLDVSAVWSNLINVIVNPLGLLAPLAGGFLNALNIPGLDASKIISGQFAQTAIVGLVSDLSSRVLLEGLNGFNALTNTMFRFLSGASSAWNFPLIGGMTDLNYLGDSMIGLLAQAPPNLTNLNTAHVEHLQTKQILGGQNVTPITSLIQSIRTRWFQ